MKLKDILRNTGCRMADDRSGEIDIKGITSDSRKVGEGYLFVAINGTSENGESYIGDALRKGASAIMTDINSNADCGNAARILSTDTRRSLSIAASEFYDNPSHKLKLVGITGTNGKTTTVTLLYELFRKLGYRCGLLSTIENKIEEKVYPATHTTPDPVELNRIMAEMCLEGCEYCFMEVSSHALSQERVTGLKYAGAIFSNLTHDHLDYHKTYAEYIRCKKLLFDNLDKDAFALTNADDKNGDVMVQNCRAKVYRYSCREAADFRCRIMETGLDGMQLKLDGREVWTRFIGRHNAYNILAVYAAAVLLGADREEIMVGISGLHAVSGRLEYIRGENDIIGVVDYAHTPDALENVLSTLREITEGKYRLITVFGCGGDRDRTKRPEMGKIAAEYSDKVFVTSDNPRSEDPEMIIKDIRDGLDSRMRTRCMFITDRAEAIRTAILTAEKGSVILVAGKGHENYQIIKGNRIHFDDKEIIAETFKETEHKN